MTSKCDKQFLIHLNYELSLAISTLPGSQAVRQEGCATIAFALRYDSCSQGFGELTHCWKPLVNPAGEGKNHILISLLVIAEASI